MTESTITIAIESPCTALADEGDLRRLVLHTLAQEGHSTAVSLTVVVVDDPTIHALNLQFLNHDEPTDIITFGFTTDTTEEFILPGAAPQQLGEIYISCERAAAQSAEWQSDPIREIRFLVIHGVLHLLGWDDATPEERTQMLARQETILTQYQTKPPGPQ